MTKVEINTRRVKSLIKRVNDQNPDGFDVFMLDVVKSLLTSQLSEKQAQIAIALLEKEGYISGE